MANAGFISSTVVMGGARAGGGAAAGSSRNEGGGGGAGLASRIRRRVCRNQEVLGFHGFTNPINFTQDRPTKHENSPIKTLIRPCSNL